MYIEVQSWNGDRDGAPMAANPSEIDGRAVSMWSNTSAKGKTGNEYPRCELIGKFKSRSASGHEGAGQVRISDTSHLPINDQMMCCCDWGGPQALVLRLG
jgi:hypothetical protein